MVTPVLTFCPDFFTTCNVFFNTLTFTRLRLIITALITVFPAFVAFTVPFVFPTVATALFELENTTFPFVGIFFTLNYAVFPTVNFETVDFHCGLVFADTSTGFFPTATVAAKLNANTFVTFFLFI